MGRLCYHAPMNPTDMSGEDLCEQPVLQWPEMRALAGLGALAIVLVVAIRLGSPLSEVQTQPAAAIESHPEQTAASSSEYADLEWEPVEPASLPDIESLY